MILIEKLGAKGDAVIVNDGRLIHANGFLPGDVVRLESGDVPALVTPSADRVVAFCKHFEACGGCKFQHWRDSAYQVWKHGRVVEAMLLNGLKTEVAPLIDAHGAGRRRVTLHVRKLGDVWQAGFMAEKSHKLCAIDVCPILVPQLARATEIATIFGPVLGDCDVGLTATDRGLDVSVKAERKVVEKRLSVLAGIAMRWSLARLSVNGEIFVSSAQPMVTMGRAQVSLPIGGFLQATELGEGILSDLVIAGVHKAKHVADLFSGVGTFALRLAAQSRVDAFDADKPAISALNKAVKETQGLKPVAGLVRNLFNSPVTAGELKPYDVVVLDPPRAGAEAQCRQLAKSQIQRVVYVSCDVASFVRDARILAQSGFNLATVTPVDQFKWSHHVELVGVFQR